jgi:hypothetical protein
MNIKQLVKQKVNGKKYPKLKRVRAGKMIMAWALIPFNCCVWMFPAGAVMATGIKPTIWAKGKLNQRKGNGDLQYGC